MRRVVPAAGRQLLQRRLGDQQHAAPGAYQASTMFLVRGVHAEAATPAAPAACLVCRASACARPAALVLLILDIAASWPMLRSMPDVADALRQQQDDLPLVSEKFRCIPAKSNSDYD